MTVCIDKNKNQIYLHVIGKSLQITVLGDFVFLLSVVFSLKVTDEGYFKALDSGLVVNTKESFFLPKAFSAFICESSQNLLPHNLLEKNPTVSVSTHSSHSFSFHICCCVFHTFGLTFLVLNWFLLPHLFLGLWLQFVEIDFLILNQS